MGVRLSICPLWAVSREDLAHRARMRSLETQDLRASRLAQDRFAEGVRRRIADRRAAATAAFARVAISRS